MFTVSSPSPSAMTQLPLTPALQCSVDVCIGISQVKFIDNFAAKVAE